MSRHAFDATLFFLAALLIITPPHCRQPLLIMLRH